MPLGAGDQTTVREFREWFETRYSGDARFGAALRDDRPDDALLASRFAVADRLWLELAVRPFVPQLRAGIVTDDRWRNEDLEERIEETGDTMSEFVELGFDEAGLEWRNPVVEHFREQGKYFCFVTSLELKSLGDLSDAAVRDRAARMFEGYYAAFGNAIRRAVAQHGAASGG